VHGLEQALTKVSDLVWGVPMVVFLFGAHLYLTFRTGFIQKHLGTAIKLSFRRKVEGDGDISNFAALTTALAATIGTGNIVGVATAVSLGGPGAVFWLWISGLFGIATKYTEALLSIKYRVVNSKGEMSGGPMYVLERGLKSRWLGVAFASFTAIAAFGIGNMVQANSIAVLMKDTFHLSPYISGAWMMFFTAIVVLGGIRAIARACEGLVPFMALFYIIGCAIILTIHFKELPDTLMLILSSAFSGQAAIGGFAGAGAREAMRFGIARGLFSNESGLGSAPIVAAAARTKDPVQQALVSSTGTFWDTIVVCAMTGLVLVNSGDWSMGTNGALLAKEAFTDIPVIGPLVLTVGLLTFVFSTIIGWAYYGEKAVEYLFGLRAIKPYRYLWVTGVLVGSITTLRLVWTFADIMNALMAVPNIIALLMLSKVARQETDKYIKEYT